jgi:hypothetical protein
VFATGTLHASKLNGCVSEACHPIFRYEGSTVNPGVPAGTMMAVMSRAAPVRAVTVTSAVIGVPEFVMNAFEPSMTHSSPSRRARVRVALASLPASDSVSPNAASVRPAQRSGS